MRWRREAVSTAHDMDRPGSVCRARQGGVGEVRFPDTVSERWSMRRGRDHKWAFVRRFRRHAFGWKSRPAVQRVQEAVREIKTVARSDSLLAAEGAVVFLERVSPAIE